MLLRSRIFGNYVPRDAAQLTLMATDTAAAEATAQSSGENIPFMREEDKEIRERDVNLFVEQNRLRSRAGISQGVHRLRPTTHF